MSVIDGDTILLALVRHLGHECLNVFGEVRRPGAGCLHCGNLELGLVTLYIGQ